MTRAETKEVRKRTRATKQNTAVKAQTWWKKLRHKFFSCMGTKQFFLRMCLIFQVDKYF